MNGYQTLRFKITGVAPLLFHNGQLADPLNPHSQSLAEVHKKRKKTEADHAELGRREWFGSMYVSGGVPCIPADMIEAALIRGAMKEKRGPAAKAGLLVEKNATLEYDGPRDPKELWKDERFRLRVPVRVGQQKVVRTRPRFENWGAEVEVKFLPSLLNRSEVESFAATAGEQMGFGDWRPRFGRFTVERL